MSVSEPEIGLYEAARVYLKEKYLSCFNTNNQSAVLELIWLKCTGII